MRIYSNGNVFIGSSPFNAGFRLDVNGTGRFSNTLETTSGGTEKHIRMLGYNNSYVSLNSNVGFDTSYNSFVTIVNANSNTTSQGNALIPSWLMALGGSLPDADSFVIGRSPAGSFSFSNLFKLSSSGAATFSSSVGINGGDFRYRPNGDVTGGPALVIKDDGSNSTLDISSEIIGDANAISNPITFRVSNVSAGRFEAMRITSDGNVGIGTPSPSEKLEVNGNVLLRSAGAIKFNRADNLIFTQLYDAGTYFALDNRNGNGFDFQSAGTSQMRITSGGQVLINTTTSTTGGVNHPLVVKGTSTSSQGIWVEANGNDNAVYIDHSGAVGKIGTSYRVSGSYTPLTFETSGSDRIRIFSNGNVGINTGDNDAGFRLDVNGTFRSTALWTTAGGVTQWGNAGTAYGGLTWDTGYAAIYGTGGNDLRFGADGSSPKMILKTSGNVGIGTTSPTNYSGFNTLQITGKSDTGGGVLRLTSFDSSAGVNFYAQTGGIFTNTTTSSPIVWLTQDTERMRITSDGLVYMYEVYNNTSGSGANVGINSLGLLYRSTSSLKYKKNVENYEKGLDVIMQMRPVTYNSINENEDGLQYAGLIAEEIHELGLTEFVQYAEDGSPDALSYANMVSLLVKGIQELKAEIEILKQNK
jgi:hypothetical protein